MHECTLSVCVCLVTTQEMSVNVQFMFKNSGYRIIWWLILYYLTVKSIQFNVQINISFMIYDVRCCLFLLFNSILQRNWLLDEGKCYVLVVFSRFFTTYWHKLTKLSYFGPIALVYSVRGFNMNSFSSVFVFKVDIFPF